MKKSIKYMIAGIAMLMAWSAGAQQVRYVYQMPYERQYRINWTEASPEGQRYTIAVRPFYLAYGGIKFDFEMELNRPGDWLGLEVGMYRKRRYDAERD